MFAAHDRFRIRAVSPARSSFCGSSCPAPNPISTSGTGITRTWAQPPRVSTGCPSGFNPWPIPPPPRPASACPSKYSPRTSSQLKIGVASEAPNACDETVAPSSFSSQPLCTPMPASPCRPASRQRLTARASYAGRSAASARSGWVRNIPCGSPALGASTVPSTPNRKSPPMTHPVARSCGSQSQRFPLAAKPGEADRGQRSRTHREERRRLLPREHFDPGPAQLGEGAPEPEHRMGATAGAGLLALQRSPRPAR